MNYALMKDAKVMYRGPTGAEWHSVLLPVSDQVPRPPLMLWATREGAEAAARMQGAAVIPAVVPTNRVRNAV